MPTVFLHPIFAQINGFFKVGDCKGVIFIDKKNLRQILVQNPISLPPKITIFTGNNKEGKKIRDINVIPLKKKIENIKFLIMPIKSYIKSLCFCLFLIT